MNIQSCRANLLQVLFVYLTTSAALCSDVNDAGALLDEKMQTAKYCSPITFSGWPQEDVNNTYFITEISMLGTAENDKDFVATVLVSIGGMRHIVIQSTNGPCGPWIWKRDLYPSDVPWGSPQSGGGAAVLYHHRDAPADWFKYWVIWMGGELKDGYMAGFVDLDRLTTNYEANDPERFLGVVYVVQGNLGYERDPDRFPGKPYAEAFGKTPLHRIDAPYIYDIVENTIHFRFRTHQNAPFKGSVTVPKYSPEHIGDFLEYGTYDQQQSAYMRFDGNFQEQLTKLEVYSTSPGDWFWYNKKKYMITFVVHDFLGRTGSLNVYSGEENGEPRRYRLSFKRPNYTVEHFHPHLTTHNGKMYLSHYVSDPKDFFIMMFDWPHGPPELIKQEWYDGMPLPDCPNCIERMRILDLFE